MNLAIQEESDLTQGKIDIKGQIFIPPLTGDYVTNLQEMFTTQSFYQS